MSTPRKVALVTGAATGIGRAVALRFAAQGLAVAVNWSRSQAEARDTVQAVEAHGVPALSCQANVADDAAVRAMIARTRDELGGLDVLVNNAGTTRFIAHADLEAVTAEVWDEIFGVNVRGTFQCIRAALPLLRQRKGAVVNVTSVAGLQGDGSSIPYAASKAALNTMTKSLARVLAPEVRINAVAPGPVRTRWLAGYEDRVEKMVKQTPLGRAAEPEDIADVVVFLALGQQLMTGQVIVVDGGRTM
jgi:3-oxoacyl-[acyl-carrier protein] reductase